MQIHKLTKFWLNKKSCRTSAIDVVAFYLYHQFVILIMAMCFFEQLRCWKLSLHLFLYLINSIYIMIQIQVCINIFGNVWEFSINHLRCNNNIIKYSIFKWLNPSVCFWKIFFHKKNYKYSKILYSNIIKTTL